MTANLHPSGNRSNPDNASTNPHGGYLSSIAVGFETTELASDPIVSTQARTAGN